MNTAYSARNRRDRRIFFKWSARRTMSEKGNLLRLIFGVLFCILISDAFIYLYEVLVTFVPYEITPMLTAAEMIIFIILVVPLFYGLMRMAFLMADGRETKISDLLWGYDSFSRMRTLYEVLLPRAARDLIVGGFSYFSVLGAAKVISGKPDIASLMTSPVTIAIAFVLAVVISGFMPTAFVLPEMCFIYADGAAPDVKKVKKNARRCIFEIAVFNMSFLGLTALSVLTLGILHFVYIIPYYLLARANFVSYIISLEK